MELNRGTLNAPCCKVRLHFEQMQGMRLRREVEPKKPRRKYSVYRAECPKCYELYSVRV